MEDPQSEFKNDGLSLKELLSQGVDDPLGLESFCHEFTSGRNLNSSGYQGINSSTPIPEKHPVLQNDTAIVIDDDGDSMHSLLCLELGNFETGGDEWHGKERLVLDQADNASMNPMKLDLDLEVSNIVDEVLKEEDKSYIFEDDTEKWGVNLESSSTADQEIYQGWLNEPQLDGAVLNGDPTTMRELSLHTNTDAHSPFFGTQYSHTQEGENLTSTATIRSVVMSEPCLSTQARFAHRTCVDSAIDFNHQTNMVEQVVQVPPNANPNTEQLTKKVLQTPFKRPTRPTLATPQVNTDIRERGQICQINPLEEPEKHLFLSPSQILVTDLFSTAILVPQPIRRVKVVPAQAVLRRKVPNDEAEENDTGDNTIDCVDCGKRLRWPCLAHSLGLVLDTPVIRNGSLKDRAKYTLPWPLELKQSKVGGAGLGVWSSAHLPRGLIFGPYEGIIASTAPSSHSVTYSWAISRSGCEPFFVDASNPSFSNWLRFVNCGRTAAENNLEAIQYRGQIYYRTTRGIERGSELMVWYGDAFGRELGIERGSRHWYGIQSNQVIECSGCAKKFNQESDLYHHNCHLRTTSNSTPQMPSLQTQAKRRGRPKKVIKESRPTSTKYVTDIPSSSSSKHVLMNITSEEKSSKFRSYSREFSKEVCFATNTISFSENRGVDNFSSHSGVPFSPRRTRGAIRKAETQQMTSKSRNTAVKSVKHGRFSKTKSVLEPGLSFSRDYILSSDPQGRGNENFSTPQTNEEECKGKMVIANFRNSQKGSKVPFHPIEAEDTKNQEAESNVSSSSHFQCSTCGVSCENHLEILEHDLSHLKTWPLQCGLCLKRFKTFEELYWHFSTMLPSGLVVEGSPIASVKTLRNPVLLQEMEEQKLLTCKNCQDLLRHTKNLVVILKDHLINSHQSGFTNLFNEIHSLDPAVFLNIEKENFPFATSDSCCPICFEVLELKDVKRHLALHSKLISIPRCNLCYAWFPSRTFLNDHAECHKHCLRLLDMPCDKIKVVDMINQLPNSFLSRLQLQLSNSRDAPCNLPQSVDWPTQSTQPLDQLRASHMASLSKTNQMERNALQFNCPRDAKDSELTPNDPTVESTQQKFFCSDCNLVFDSSLTFKRHKLTHNVPYPCKVCHKSFETTFLLKQHRKIHRKVITYDCKRCEKSFRTKSSYLFHISTHATPLSAVFNSPTTSSASPLSITHPRASTTNEQVISQCRDVNDIDLSQYQTPNSHQSHTHGGQSYQNDTLIRIGLQDAILNCNSQISADNAADIHTSIPQLSEMAQHHLECISPL